MILIKVMMSNKTSDQSQNICGVTADNENYTMTFLGLATSSGPMQMWRGSSSPDLVGRQHLALRMCRYLDGNTW